MTASPPKSLAAQHRAAMKLLERWLRWHPAREHPVPGTLSMLARQSQDLLDAARKETP